MKIAIFSGEIPSTTFIEQLILGVSNKHEVLLFGAITKPYKELNANIKIYKTPTSLKGNLGISIYRTFLLLLKSPQNLFLLINEVKKFPTTYDQWVWYSKFLPLLVHKPDILHLQWARDVEFYTFLGKFDIKIIVSLRGAHINYTPIIDERARKSYLETFPQIDGFHAVSKAIALESQKYGADINKIKVIHSPVPKYFFSKFNNEFSKTGKLKIISIGRPHWKKGYRYGLDAMKILLTYNVDFKYDILGISKPNEELMFQRNQLELDTHVNFLDAIHQRKLCETMRGYDVLLLNSVEEGIANVVLEAMALGLPVVSTDCGGMPEVVMPDKTGWIVPTRNPQALAEALIEVNSTSENKLNEIRKNAHDFVKQNFNAESSIAEFIELYETVLKN